MKQIILLKKIGVDRAIEYIDRSDLVLYVIDATTDLNNDDYEIIEKIKDKNAIILLNKSDLECKITKQKITQELNKPVFAISTKTESGIMDLTEHIKKMFFHGDLNFNDQVYITNIRHKQALLESLSSLNQVLQSMADQMPEDFLTIDLMNAYEKLGEIIGESVDEDLVNTIFSEFCMGK